MGTAAIGFDSFIVSCAKQRCNGKTGLSCAQSRLWVSCCFSAEKCNENIDCLHE
jgi:hypothetical protein